ncbi:MAG: hypothetical protein ACFFDH_23710 [Promethearchaeota archaeon]
MDWSSFLDNIGVWYETFISWFLEQPIYGQVLVIIGIVAILALLVTIIYYIIKGIAYLIYYIIKGVYYLLKGIGYGFYKLFEGFYLLISGKTKSSTNKTIENNIQKNTIDERQYFVLYCSECGSKFSEKMRKHLEINGMVFCVKCGNQFKLNYTLKTLTLSH